MTDSKHSSKHSAHKTDHVRHSDSKNAGNLFYMLVVVVALVMGYNQIQVFNAESGLVSLTQTTEFSSGSGDLSDQAATGVAALEGSNTIIGPQLNSDGRTTILVEWPAISNVPKPQDTGDPVQDAINYIVPTGTPWYLADGVGAQLEISFDDPIQAQQVWGQFGRSLQLDGEKQQRYEKLVSIFTCDFCCGGPTSVTTINRCGCAHAYAWKGIAKFFVEYYGDDYSDEEILGEMTRWKGLWYPKGMIEMYLVYVGQADASTLNYGGSVGIRAQFEGEGTGGSASISELGDLPGMVGGC
ncbi:MAG: hypothetical protein ACE5DI_02505 [Candidatus Micrarchaeia archaeon]